MMSSPRIFFACDDVTNSFCHIPIAFTLDSLLLHCLCPLSASCHSNRRQLDAHLPVTPRAAGRILGRIANPMLYSSKMSLPQFGSRFPVEPRPLVHRHAYLCLPCATYGSLVQGCRPPQLIGSTPVPNSQLRSMKPFLLRRQTRSQIWCFLGDWRVNLR